MSEERQYAERKIWPDLHPYYERHVSVMTGEGLHDKASIAAELAHRDKQIDALLAALRPIMNYPGIREYIGSILADRADSAIAARESNTPTED